MSSSSSSHSLQPDQAISDAFRLWVKDLDALQRESQELEKEFTSSDPAVIITAELARRGIDISTPIEVALEHLQQMQDVDPTMKEQFQQQWSLYRVALQEHAPNYFARYATETPDFMKKYFSSITFATLWNDVWVNHMEPMWKTDVQLSSSNSSSSCAENHKRRRVKQAGTAYAGGGREFAILNGVQKRLLEAEKPGRMANKVALSRRKQEDVIPFTAAELAIVCNIGMTAIVKQINLQQVVLKSLRAQLIVASKQFSNMKATAGNITTTLHLISNINPHVVENGSDNKQLEHVRRTVQMWCTSILNTGVLHTVAVVDKLLEHVKAERDEKASQFQSMLAKKTAWQDKYKAFVRATMASMKASELRDCLTRVDGDSKRIPEVASLLAGSALNDAYCAKLATAQETTRTTYMKEVQQLLLAAERNDAAQYNYFILLECRSKYAMSDGRMNVAGMQAFLRANAETRLDTPINMLITKDNRDKTSEMSMAFQKIKATKAELADSIAERPLIESDGNQTDIADAAQVVCEKVLQFLNSATAQDQPSQAKAHRACPSGKATA